MANQRLQHDVALMMKDHLIEFLAPALIENLQQEVQEGIFAICLAGLEAYAVYDDRMHLRMKPTKN